MHLAERYAWQNEDEYINSIESLSTQNWYKIERHSLHRNPLYELFRSHNSHYETRL